MSSEIQYLLCHVDRLTRRPTRQRSDSGHWRAIAGR